MRKLSIRQKSSQSYLMYEVVLDGEDISEQVQELVLPAQEKTMKTVTLKRIKSTPKQHMFGCVVAGSYSEYQTKDGRFQITGGANEWQIKALDGSRPFRGFFKGSSCEYFNGETLRECREMLSMIYGCGD